MNEKIEHTVKVGAEGCCCTGSGSWCKFFFEKKDKSTVSHPVTPVARTAPDNLEAPKK